MTKKAKSAPSGVTLAKGYLAAGVRCGLKSRGEDLAVIFSQTPAQAAAVYTRNQVCAAPIQLCRKHLRRPTAQAVVVNAGIANACTGPEGLADAAEMAQRTAAALGLKPTEVLVASTGVIGQRLNQEKIRRGIEAACRSLSRGGSAEAARAIMTTDLAPKSAQRKITLGAQKARVALGGIAKGSGMIHPNMATMLAFLTTDAAIDARCLRRALRSAVDETFNMITVDGDTSTNDMVLLLANGRAAHCPITDFRSPEYESFRSALVDVCRDLSIQIARDGEGATRLIRIDVEAARSRSDARAAAKSVAGSNLVKTAIFGKDPNWGRILCAVGYSKARVDPDKIQLWIGGHLVVQQGRPAETIDPQQLRQALEADEVCLRVHLGQGRAAATAWTCDLTYDYIRINAEYHT